MLKENGNSTFFSSSSSVYLILHSPQSHMHISIWFYIQKFYLELYVVFFDEYNFWAVIIWNNHQVHISLCLCRCMLSENPFCVAPLQITPTADATVYPKFTTYVHEKYVTSQAVCVDNFSRYVEVIGLISISALPFYGVFFFFFEGKYGIRRLQIPQQGKRPILQIAVF